MIARFEEICANLDRLDEPVPETQKISLILSGLPSKWRFFISAWDSVPKKSQSFSMLVSRLLREESRDQGSESRNDDKQVTALLAESRSNGSCSCKCHSNGCKPCVPQKLKSNTPCSYCGKSGHNSSRCFKRKKESKGFSTASNPNGNSASGSAASKSANVAVVDSSSVVHFALVSLTETQDSHCHWIVDSGATDHMACRKEW